MENILETLKSVAGKARDTIVSYFKDKTKPDVTINDLIQLVKSHPDVIKNSKCLLGLHFHFYRFTIGETTYYLETKGKKEEIVLEFWIQHTESRVVNYKSYQANSDLNAKVSVDQECFFSLLK